MHGLGQSRIVLSAGSASSVSRAFTQTVLNFHRGQIQLRRIRPDMKIQDSRGKVLLNSSVPVKCKPRAGGSSVDAGPMSSSLYNDSVFATGLEKGSDMVVKFCDPMFSGREIQDVLSCLHSLCRRVALPQRPP
jgi:hypothetical protein